MKRVVVGSDDVIFVHLDSHLTKTGLDMRPYFQAGGDVICNFQNSDGVTASSLSWSATGGQFPSTVVPDGPSGGAGDFHINVPRQASSGWLPMDPANMEIVFQDITGRRTKRNIEGKFSIVPDDIQGTM
jgi:hypothetical protein